MTFAPGRHGDFYLLVPPYLDTALNMRFGPGAPTVPFAADGVARDHPFAAVMQLPTTESCLPLLSQLGAAPLGLAETMLDQVEFYVVPTAPPS